MLTILANMDVVYNSAQSSVTVSWNTKQQTDGAGARARFDVNGALDVIDIDSKFVNIGFFLDWELD